MRPGFALLLVWISLIGPGGSVSGSPLSPKDRSAGRKLYLTKCAKCHKLYDPASYPDDKWQTWVSKMSRKSKLTPEQEKLLSRYIQGELRSPVAKKSGQVEQASQKKPDSAKPEAGVQDKKGQ